MNEELLVERQNLRHPDKNMRGKAAIALGNMGGDAARDALLAAVGHDADFYVREDISWALVRIGEAAVLPLISMLQSEDAAVRHHAAHTLGKIGDARAITPLIAVLDDVEAAVVSKAAFTLGLLGGEKVVPELTRLLAHPDREVQNTVITALEGIGVSAAPALVTALASENPQVRELAADILGLLETRDYVPALVPLLYDAEWRVRFAAVTALGHLGGAEAKAALAALPQDQDKRVKSLVARVLKRIKP